VWLILNRVSTYLREKNFEILLVFFFSPTTRITETSNQKLTYKENDWHNFLIVIKKINMNNWLKTLIAGYAGWKWGGGCLGFIVVFAIVYFFLGHC